MPLILMAFYGVARFVLKVLRAVVVDHGESHPTSSGTLMRLKPFSIAVALLAGSTLASATTVTAFSENFEGTLAAWTGIGGGAITQAAIVLDPLNGSNHVLGFPQLGSGGSIYSSNFITTTGDFTVSFDYLGLPRSGSVPGNLGGFFGISQATPGNHYWVAGTGSYPAPIGLIDDGAWHTYTLTFSSPIGQTVRLMYEDFVGSGGVTGDVFFDNIRFNDSSVTPAPFGGVPEPSGLALLGAAALAAAAARRRTPGA